MEIDENGESSVKSISTEQIWRYLFERRKIVQAVLSTITAYAEKYQAIKDKWILMLQNIKDESYAL
jgi:hypothetical protein